MGAVLESQGLNVHRHTMLTHIDNTRANAPLSSQAKCVSSALQATSNKIVKTIIFFRFKHMEDHTGNQS